MIPELVTIHTSLLTDLGDAVRERFGVSGDKTLPELTAIVDPNVPDDYDVLEYIQSSGTQYIETDVIPDKFTSVRITFLFPSLPPSGTYYGLFGTDKENVESQHFSAYTSNNSMYCRQYFNSNKYNTYASAANRKDTLGFGGGNTQCSTSTNNYQLDPIGGGNQIDSYNNADNLKLYFFALNSSGSPVFIGKFRFFDSQVFNNLTGEMLGNFVPVKRKSDNEVGVYNKVTKVFCPNKGTDPFIIPT